MIIKIAIESPNGAKMNLSFEVPDNSTLTTSCDHEYLNHQNHPEYAETGNIRITPAEKEFNKVVDIEKRLPPEMTKTFVCETHGKFTDITLSSKSQCPECGELCDLAEPPKEDYESISCITCGVQYRKSTGGKYGTCPSCTTVRCPTCKQPATLQEMNGGQLCKSCRGE